MFERPGDARGFVHKRLLKGIGGLVGGVSGIASSLVPAIGVARGAIGIGRGVFGRPAARPVAPRTTTARPSLAGAQGKELARNLKFPELGAPAPQALTLPSPRTFGRRPPGIAPEVGPCPSGTIPDPEGAGFCVSPKSQFGKGRGAERAPVGDAVMGRYGAALEPGVMIIERSVCLPGMQLGNDGLCYNKGAITNSQRQWPRGRRPLLTGGEMRAIGIAARAGSKLERTTKRLRSLGMMKALPKGRAAPRAHAHAKPAAAVSVSGHG